MREPVRDAAVSARDRIASRVVERPRTFASDEHRVARHAEVLEERHPSDARPPVEIVGLGEPDRRVIVVRAAGLVDHHVAAVPLHDVRRPRVALAERTIRMQRDPVRLGGGLERARHPARRILLDGDGVDEVDLQVVTHRLLVEDAEEVPLAARPLDERVVVDVVRASREGRGVEDVHPLALLDHRACLRGVHLIGGRRRRWRRGARQCLLGADPRNSDERDERTDPTDPAPTTGHPSSVAGAGQRAARASWALKVPWFSVTPRRPVTDSLRPAIGLA